MGRYLLILIFLFIAAVIIKHLVNKPRTKNDQPKKVKSETMVKCAHCNLHIPEADAIKQNGEFFCSDKHLAEHNKKK